MSKSHAGDRWIGRIVRLRGHKHHGGKYDGKLALVFGRTAKKYRVWVEGVDHQLEYYPEKFILAETIKRPLAAVDQVQKVALTDTTEASAAAPVSKLQASESTLVKTETDSIAVTQAAVASNCCGAASNCGSAGTQATAVSNTSEEATAVSTDQIDSTPPVNQAVVEDQRGLPSLRVEQFKYQNQAANLVCVVCKQVPVNEWEPLELRCKHLFCWGCLKNALATSKECPHCRAPAAVSEVQVSKKANRAISSLLLLVATTPEGTEPVESVAVPLGMIREMNCAQGLTLAAARALSQLPILIERQTPGLCSPKASSQQRKPKAEPRVVVHQLQHSTSTIPVEAADEVDSGCSSSQRTANSFHESIISEFEQSSRLLQRHLGGCTEHFGEQYVSGLIKRTGEQLHRSLKRHCTLNNNNSPSRCNNNNNNKPAQISRLNNQGGVAALAALAHELLSPGGSAKHSLAPMSVQQ